MTRFIMHPLSILLPVLLPAVAGCSEHQPQVPAASNPATHQVTQQGHDHEHSMVGPHNGELMELGNEEYHAELLHPHDDGDPQTVTVWIYDSMTENQVAITDDTISINLVDDGNPVQFRLSALPDDGDPDGQSSRFVSDDADLISSLGRSDVDVRIVLRIDGKSYSGSFHHDHDHAHP